MGCTTGKSIYENGPRCKSVFFYFKRTLSGVFLIRSRTLTTSIRLAAMYFRVISLVRNSCVNSVMAEIETFNAAPKVIKRRQRRIFCGHCERAVPASTYYRHRELFFDVVAQEWQRSAASFAESTESLHETNEG